MFRRDNVAIDAHLEATPRLFKSKQKRFLHLHLSQKWKPVIATEGEEVRLPGVMKPLESVGH
jgi:hypothetical protein